MAGPSVLTPTSTVAAPRRGTVADSVLRTIGNTPLVRLTGYLEASDVTLLCKLEAANPGGSAKDRPALRMLEEAIDAGVVHPDTVVVESTSGNTGIGLAQVCRYYGLRCILVLDERTPTQTRAALRALGAEVEVVVPDDADADLLRARLDRVLELVATLPGAFWPNQYADPANPRAHADGTMAEIAAALDGDVDVVFVAVSSTGTLGGCLDHIAARGLRTEVVAVDAHGSVLFDGVRGPRLLPGLGAGQVPALSFGRVPARVTRVSDLDCVVGCRRVARTDALLVGGSAGGVLHAVRRSQRELAGATVVAIAADTGHRYLDTVFDDDWVRDRLGCGPRRLARLVGETQVARL